MINVLLLCLAGLCLARTAHGMGPVFQTGFEASGSPVGDRFGQPPVDQPDFGIHAVDSAPRNAMAATTAPEPGCMAFLPGVRIAGLVGLRHRCGLRLGLTGGWAI